MRGYKMRERELKDLLKDLTIEEKIHQLLQLPGSYYEKDAAITGGINNGLFTEKQVAQAGSVLGIHGAKKIRKIQKDYVENHPHHIPLLFMLDVIHGLRTIFPIPLAQGATFNPELIKSCTEASARETAVSGVHVTFAPMSDLVRDPRWGRVMEATGEDPYLNARMTEAMVQGFQGEDVGQKGRVAACVKHFAGYGAPEAGREYNNVELSEHTLREFYLPAYQAGIEAGSELVMTSFNTLNGIPSSGNQWLLRKVLRGEMGFEGILISDWAAIEEMIAHGFCDNMESAAEKAITAGVDIDMVTTVYVGHLKNLVEAGKIDEKLIDESVWRVLKLKNKMGLFENPFKDADEQNEKVVTLCQGHRELARQAARESFVLLKNETDKNGKEILPLDAGKKVAFIGPYVETKELHSTWAIVGKAQDAVSVRMAAEEILPKEKMSYAYGSRMWDKKEHLSRHSYEELTEDVGENEEQLLQEAQEVAKEADIVVLCLGESRLLSGEAASRAEISIPDIQKKLLEKVYEVNQNIVTVLFSGRPLDLRDLSEKSKALLEVWLPGTEGGHAIIDTLTGKYNPSGKLPMSMPYSVGQVPIYYNNYATGRPLKEKDSQTFYKSRYLDIPNEPLYPFGYGLSYTNFEISPIQLSSKIMNSDNQIVKAAVEIKNIGNIVGTEILQLYIRDVTASIVRPIKELKGFQRITLQPKEKQEVEFVINEEMLRFHNSEGEFISEKGEIQVWIGNSSASSEWKSFLNDL